MKRVLFVCVHNSGRSQMAEAFAKHLSQEAIEAESAGTMPLGKVNPLVVKVMKEKGIELSRNRPKLLTQQMTNAPTASLQWGATSQRLAQQSTRHQRTGGWKTRRASPSRRLEGSGT